jgi:hypothetical protein
VLLTFLLIAHVLAPHSHRYYCRIAAFEEAVDVAARLRNEEMFEMIRQTSKGRRDVLKLIADKQGAK